MKINYKKILLVLLLFFSLILGACSFLETEQNPPKEEDPIIDDPIEENPQDEQPQQAEQVPQEEETGEEDPKEDEQPQDDYSKISELKLGEAKTKGVVLAVNKESFLLGDETGNILVYLGNTWTIDLAIGDTVNVSGNVVSYGKSIQFDKSSTYTKEGTWDIHFSKPKEVDKAALDNYLSVDEIKAEYVSVAGTLIKSGSYYNLIIDGAKAVISVAYPIDASSLNNYLDKEVKITGFITSVSSNKYVSIIYNEIELAKANNFISYDEYELSYKEYLYSVLGNDIIIYSNDVDNPYGIDLDIYGDDVYCVFTSYDISSATDPYVGVDKEEFYNNYSEADSYIDSYFRSLHGLMSGDITPQGHIPNKFDVTYEDTYIYLTHAFYVLDYNVSYLGSLPNDLEGNFQMIWYGGAYASLNEVAAYILAFGETPVNNKYDKSKGKSDCIADFGIYGRVNQDIMMYDSSKWPYEPEMPGISIYEYTETDFGTLGGYTNENKITGTKYTQKVYNTGTTINRGAARFCFISDKSIKSINQRKVFYTYNHYNDFEEYLNYNNGFGKRFGNESAGNEYCGSKSDFEKSAKSEPTSYPNIKVMNLVEIFEIIE